MKRKQILLPIGVLLLAGLASALIFGYRASAQETPAEWPGVTMFYQTTGEYDTVGETPVTTTLKYRLVYDSKDQWKEEIISATPVRTRVGTFSRQGSYQEVRDGQYRQYDSVTGETIVETLDENSIQIPRSKIRPVPMDKLEQGFGKAGTPVNTTVRVCFNDQCENNAQGLLFDNGRTHFIYADDQRGIPIGLSGLNITEVTIHDSQEAVVR